MPNASLKKQFYENLYFVGESAVDFVWSFNGNNVYLKSNENMFHQHRYTFYNDSNNICCSIHFTDVKITTSLYNNCSDPNYNSDHVNNEFTLLDDFYHYLKNNDAITITDIFDIYVNPEYHVLNPIFGNVNLTD